MVGTVRKNRAELPAELLIIKNRAPQSSTFATARVSYCPKKGKNVVLMSRNAEIGARGPETKHDPDYDATKGGGRQRGQSDRVLRPQANDCALPLVIFYNTMDGSYKRRIFLQELGKAPVGSACRGPQPLQRSGRGPPRVHVCVCV